MATFPVRWIDIGSRMNFVQLHSKSRKQIFIGSSIAFCLLVVFSSQVDAQIFRRLRSQSFSAAPHFFDPVANASNVGHSGFAGQQGSRIVSSQAPISRLPKWPFGNSNGYDPRIHRDADALSRYPKYIGGFHSSHFTNAGLPSGDIGFRSNGIYWTPW